MISSLYASIFRAVFSPIVLQKESKTLKTKEGKHCYLRQWQITPFPFWAGTNILEPKWYNLPQQHPATTSASYSLKVCMFFIVGCLGMPLGPSNCFWLQTFVYICAHCVSPIHSHTKTHYTFYRAVFCLIVGCSILWGRTIKAVKFNKRAIIYSLR